MNNMDVGRENRPSPVREFAKAGCPNSRNRSLSSVPGSSSADAENVESLTFTRRQNNG